MHTKFALTYSLKRIVRSNVLSQVKSIADIAHYRLMRVKSIADIANYRLMHVKSIAECSKGSILQYF